MQYYYVYSYYCDSVGNCELQEYKQKDVKWHESIFKTYGKTSKYYAEPVYKRVTKSNGSAEKEAYQKAQEINGEILKEEIEGI